MLDIPRPPGAEATDPKLARLAGSDPPIVCAMIPEAVAVGTGREQVFPAISEPEIAGMIHVAVPVMSYPNRAVLFVQHGTLGPVMLDVTGLVSADLLLTIGAFAVKQVEKERHEQLV